MFISIHETTFHHHIILATATCDQLFSYRYYRERNNIVRQSFDFGVENNFHFYQNRNGSQTFMKIQYHSKAKLEGFSITKSFKISDMIALTTGFSFLQSTHRAGYLHQRNYSR